MLNNFFEVFGQPASIRVAVKLTYIECQFNWCTAQFSYQKLLLPLAIFSIDSIESSKVSIEW